VLSDLARIRGSPRRAAERRDLETKAMLRRRGMLLRRGPTATRRHTGGGSIWRA
jgi:hypothetical protein